MDFDWNLCSTCQEIFLAKVCQFREQNILQTPIHFYANESVASFAMHYASWHKSCYLKYNGSKLAKLKKRSVCECVYDYDRSRSNLRVNAINTCLFCEKGCEEAGLH